ncbi:MAG: hypothetical protein EBR10_06240, partial [Planctomycetes bacterium]|nr:hypothetical protein [Planctomycetota bacterium]
MAPTADAVSVSRTLGAAVASLLLTVAVAAQTQPAAAPKSTPPKKPAVPTPAATSPRVATGITVHTVAPAAAARAQGAAGTAGTAGEPTELASEPQDVLFALMNTRLPVTFDETPARDALTFIAQAANVAMVPRWRSDRNPDGMDPDEPITMQLPSLTALDALEYVLAQLPAESSCTWQLRPGFLEVGTRENLSRRGSLVTKLYPIKDLLYTVPYFDNAPNFNL